MKTCPKCGYVRQPQDEAPDYECPKCGVIYAKAQPSTKDLPPAWRVPQKPERHGDEAPTQNLGQSLLGAVVIGALAVFGWTSCTSGGSSGSRAERQAESAARERCADAIRADATFPASVDIKWFLGVQTVQASGGNILVSMDFTAKNAFGAELPFHARCMIDTRGGLVSYNVNRR